MAAQGTASIDFGAFPGKTDASLVITGQTGILAGSLVEAWILPGATADHSADEHLVEPIYVIAGNIVAGTGFTIYAMSMDIPAVPDLAVRVHQRDRDNTAPMPYGLWKVAWCWN
jgi:hypothetical protein